MPQSLPRITEETVARRLELHPGTVTLDGVKTIYRSLSDSAGRDGHIELQSDTRNAAAEIQELIDTPKPQGLVASARLIASVDSMLLEAEALRLDTARTYDRFDSHTAQATEALEILTAYSILLEATDLELRTGHCAA